MLHVVHLGGAQCTCAHLYARMLCLDSNTGAVQTEIDAHQEHNIAEAGAARGAATCREARHGSQVEESKTARNNAQQEERGSIRVHVSDKGNVGVVYDAETTPPALA